MIIHIMNDIFSAKHTNTIICQQVNCQGKMGSGLAKAIKERYPEVYKQYMQDFKDNELQLGNVSFVATSDGNIVANICGQEFYGYDGAQYTSYDALAFGLAQVFDFAKELDYNIVIPYKIGCGLGGGDWDRVVRDIDIVFKGTENTIAYNLTTEELKQYE